MELQNDQYDALISEYNKKQHRSRHLTEKRYQEIINKIPAFSDLDNTISTLSMEAAVRALDGDETALTELRTGIDQIKQKKETLLLENGFTANYLTPSYECSACKDTGYIGSKKCHCFERAIVEMLYSQSNIRHLLEKENFQHFSTDCYPDDMVDSVTSLTSRDNIFQILKIAHEFVNHFDEIHGNLLLYGNTGVGKTFLSHCIAKELLDRSHTVVYLTSVELFDILGKYKFDRESSAQKKSTMLSYIYDCELLIIDDLGTELTNNFTSSQLYHCIDSRLTRERSTIISTNLSFDDLSIRYTERIFSRIMSNYKLLKIFGKDIRIEKAVNNII